MLIYLNYMKNIMNWFTKKRMFMLGLFGAVGFVVLVQKNVGYFLYDTCKEWNLEWSNACVDTMNYFGLIFLVGATALIPSMAMFFVKDGVFESWKKTFIIYIYIYIGILIIVPWSGGDAYLRIQKDIFALLVSVFYLAFSIILILYRSLKKDIQ